MATSQNLDLAGVADLVIAKLENEYEHKLSPLLFDVGQDFHFLGHTQAKQRPRKGKGGRFYTPPETAAFEKAVAEWGKRLFDKPFPFPVRVNLMLQDETDDPELINLSRLGLAYSSRGDVDNYLKCVLDALNGIAWRDDKQVIQQYATRAYSNVNGFYLHVARAGVSGAEYNTVVKHIKKKRPDDWEQLLNGELLNG